MKLHLALVLAFFSFAAPQAQFEAASIKPNSELKAERTMTMNPGGLIYRFVTLSDCIQAAYGVKPNQVTGPEWTRSDRYDITARSAGPSSNDEVMRMLQTLLSERFKLTFHRDKKDLQAFSLVLGKGEPKLTKSQSEGPRSMRPIPGGFAMDSTSMAELAAFISGMPGVNSPVTDATGLSGRFNFSLLFDEAGDGSDPGATKRAMASASPDAFSAALIHLGLRLEAAKTATDMIVIDHAEKPNAN